MKNDFQPSLKLPPHLEGRRGFLRRGLRSYNLSKMYCPKCAAENPESGRFCRKCGTDIAFISQALTRDVRPQSVVAYGADGLQQAIKRREGKAERPANLYKGISSVFRGVGFLFVAAAIFRFAPAGKLWWFWLLIPAFGSLGWGVAEMLRSRHEKRLLGESQIQHSIPSNRRASEIPLDLSHEEQPRSVTECTTRILEDPSHREN
jgi:hypothetical protein